MNCLKNIFKNRHQRAANDSLHLLVTAAATRHQQSADRLVSLVTDVLDENERLRSQMHHPVAPY